MADRRLSPAQIVPIVGVSESTLKRWVDAGHLRAEKTPGGHRKIAIADLIAFLRARGRPVPSAEALGLLVSQAAAADRVDPVALARLLLRGDVEVARTLLLDRFRSEPLDELLDRLVAPAMAHLGTRWAQGAIDVYEEHVATLRAWALLVELRGLLPTPPASAPLALGGAPEGDPYLLPTLMAELTLSEVGWRTLNLGPDTPVASLLAAVTRHAPRLVWLSITSTQLRPEFFDHYPRLWEAAQGGNVALVLGGQGLTPPVQDRLVATAFGTRAAHLKAFARPLTAPPAAAS